MATILKPSELKSVEYTFSLLKGGPSPRQVFVNIGQLDDRYIRLKLPWLVQLFKYYYIIRFPL